MDEPKTPAQPSAATAEQALAQAIEHTLLRPEATVDELEQLCDDAKRHAFAAVCVERRWVSLCASRLAGTGVRVVTVIGFPTGSEPTSIKVEQAREALALGAHELDMVQNVERLKARDYGAVLRDIEAVVLAAGTHPVKVILETSALCHDEKVISCALAQAAGAAFVKTSTGFGAGGATSVDVALLRATVAGSMRVKASGGIRDRSGALAILASGADRLGTSAGVAILAERA